MASSEAPPSHGPRVALRALTMADLPRMRTFVNDPEVMRASSVYTPVSDLQQEAWLRSTLQGHANAYWFGISDLRGAEPALIGTCCLVDVDWVARVAELRIRIGDRGCWGLGLGREACAILLDFAFLDLNLQRIGLRVWGANARARRLYAELGFIEEGRLRRAGYVHGVVEDLIWMGLLREEYRRDGGA